MLAGQGDERARRAAGGAFADDGADAAEPVAGGDVAAVVVAEDVGV
jgi:hypothetical protein